MTIWFVRHGKAGSRSSWSGDDAERPLSPKGFDQATTIADELVGEHITRVVSSPSLRCRQTVAPVARAFGLELEIADALDEGQGPRAALELIDALAEQGVHAVLCSHGDIIPDVLAELSRRGVDLGDLRACAKGSVWRLVVHDGRITRGEYLPPG